MDSKPNILLFCDSFPPQKTVGGRRWKRFVDALGDRYNFTILAKSSHGIEVKLEDSYPKIYRVDDFSWTLDSSIGTYADTLGATNSPVRKKSSPRFQKTRNRILESKIVEVVRRYAPHLRQIRTLLPFGDTHRSYGKVLFQRARELHQSEGFDLIIASAPGFGSLYAASSLSQEMGIPWIADFRDPWTEDYHNPIRNTSLVGRLQVAQEQRVLKNSSAVLVINRQMKDLIHCEPTLLKIIQNCSETPSEQYRCQSEVPPQKLPTIKIGYGGTVGFKSSYKKFIEIIAAYSTQVNPHDEVMIELHHFGLERSHRIFSTVFDGLQLQNFRYLPHSELPIDQLLLNLSGMDFNLVFGYSGRSAECVQTGKVFDYVVAGRPILLFSEEGDSCLAEMIEKGSLGRVIGDVGRLSSAFKEVLNSRSRKISRNIAPTEWFFENYGLEEVAKRLGQEIDTILHDRLL